MNLALLAGVSWGSGLVFALCSYLLIDVGGIGIFTGAIFASALVYFLGNIDYPKWYPKAWRKKRVTITVIFLSFFFLTAVCLPWRSFLWGLLDFLEAPLALVEGIQWFLLSFSLVAFFRSLSYFFRWFQVLELAVLVLLIASPIYGPMNHGSGKPHWLFDHLIEAGVDQSSKLPFWVISAFASFPIICFFFSFDGNSKSMDQQSKFTRIPVISVIIFVFGFCLAIVASFQAQSLISEDNRPEPPSPPPNPFEPPPPPKPPPIALVDLPDAKIFEPEGYYFRVGVLQESNQSVASLKFKPLLLEREENYTLEPNSDSQGQNLLSKVYSYEKDTPLLLLKDARRISDIRPIPKGGFSDAYAVDSTNNDFSFREAYGKYVKETGRVLETKKDKLVASLRKACRYNEVIIGSDQNSSISSKDNLNTINFFRKISYNKNLQILKLLAAEKLNSPFSPAVEVYSVINALEEGFPLSDEQGKEHEAFPIQGFIGRDYNGSATHFSLAAYYWLQALDIPSRLVTGYFLPKKGDRVEDLKYVFQAHQRIWLEVHMGKKKILKSNPQWTPIFISPKVIIDQNKPEEPDDPPEPPIEEEDQKSISSPNTPSAPTGMDRLSFYLTIAVAFIAVMLITIVIRSVLRFNLLFRHKNTGKAAMMIALRWLDLYGLRREYGESILEFSVRLEDELKLKYFKEMAECHRRAFINSDNLQERPSYWKKKLKDLRKALENHKNLRPPKKFCRDALWKIFGFPDYPQKVKNTHKERGAIQ
jgi:hypothetical protein